MICNTAGTPGSPTIDRIETLPTPTAACLGARQARSGPVEMELSPGDAAAAPSKLQMVAAFEAERHRVKSTPEPARVVEDLISREGEGSLHRALNRHVS